MAIPILVPRLGWSMTEGTFVGWLKADGDLVKPGDPLFVLEGEKATEEIEAIDAGLLRLGPGSATPGSRVEVGAVLAHLEGTATPTSQPDQPAATPAPGPAPAPERSAPPPARSPRREVAISPRARRAARAAGLDWTAAPLTGTGRQGRIRERDVLAAGGGAAPPGRLVPHTRARRAGAAAMVAGVTVAAPVTLVRELDATALQARRARERTADLSPTVTDLILFCTACTLREHPGLQAQWRDEGLFFPPEVHIALAVDAEGGLIAPVVRDADQLGVALLAARTRDLVQRARRGELSGAELRDATFTLTNLGTLGVDAFTPVITLPQSAVLGVGRIVRRPAVVGDTIVARDALTLSLTFDHRVTDGAPAARFLGALAERLERLAEEG